MCFRAGPSSIATSLPRVPRSDRLHRVVLLLRLERRVPRRGRTVVPSRRLTGGWIAMETGGCARGGGAAIQP